MTTQNTESNSAEKSLRRAGKTETRGYNVSMLQYPENLDSQADRGAGHMIVFFINVPAGSKIVKAGGENDFYQPQKTNRFSQKASDATGGDKIAFANGYKQLKDAIALHMPHDMVQTTSASYAEVKASALVNQLADSANKSSGILSGAWDAAKGVAKRVALETASSMASKAMASDKLLADKMLGNRIENPNSEQLFSGMNFRDFGFSFAFAPKSPSEASNVLRIINTFKFHMHPELSDAQYLITPAEFEIEFYSGGDVNQFIGSVSTCGLTNVEVNYTPTGRWSAFKGGDDGRLGYPTFIELRLHFKELELMTKNRLAEFGDSPEQYTELYRDTGAQPEKKSDPSTGSKPAKTSE